MWFLAVGFFASTAMGTVSIPEGEYQPLLKAGKTVKVEAFDLDETPVTNQNYLDFVKKNPQWSRNKVKRIFADAQYLRAWPGNQSIKGIENHPVVNVSWFAAKAYCEWRGMRLPTVNEWEYVAQNGPKTQKNESSAEINQMILEWYSKPGSDSVGPVRSTFENKFSVWDMHGLIWEWTLDFNSSFVTGESRGDSSLEKSMYCGSGAIGAADPTNYAAFMRFGFRSSLRGDYTVGMLGFRCAKGKGK